MSANAPSPSGLTGVIDIGSSKIACLALDAGAQGGPRWAGLGIRPAEGIKCGEIVDAGLAERAIVGAIADAERAAGAPLEAIALGLGCGRLVSLDVDLAVALDPTIVLDSDIQRLRSSARAYAERDRRTSLMEDVRQFRLDGVCHDRPPLERFGRKLEAAMSMVTADREAVARISACVERAGLPVMRAIPSPLAAGLAVTSEAERRAGITVVDLGAGLTSIATFIAGRLARLETVTLGGRQLTQDVAAALQIPFASAERIKTECASVHPAHVSGSDAYTQRIQDGFIADGHVASDGITSETRAKLCEILSPRLDTMLRHVADHLDALPSVVADSGRVVLTGGGSRLGGLAAYAARLLGRPVRLGTPQAAPGMAPHLLPALAAVAGLAGMTGQGRLIAAAPARVRAA